MQVKFLKDVVVSISGLNSVKIVDLLQGRENVNEFDISKKLKITINQTRNILYKLADYGLVSFTRKKDKKNGGWYTYFWTLDAYKSLVVLRNNLEKSVIHLEHQLNSKQTKQFYYCENCDVEMSEENALMHDFTCPECGEVFLAKDNVSSISEIKNRIGEFKEQINLIDKEIGIIVEKEVAVKERRRKAEERKKKAKRAAARKARIAVRKKTDKKKPKKRSVKKKGIKKKIGKRAKRKLLNRRVKKKVKTKFKTLAKTKRLSSRRKIIKKPLKTISKKKLSIRKKSFKKIYRVRGIFKRKSSRKKVKKKSSRRRWMR